MPHYWDHVAWVFGKSSVEEVIEVSAKLSLKGVLHQIKCPILVVHGENDRQIPLGQAKQLVADCVSSPKAERWRQLATRAARCLDPVRPDSATDRTEGR